MAKNHIKNWSMSPFTNGNNPRPSPLPFTESSVVPRTPASTRIAPIMRKTNDTLTPLDLAPIIRAQKNQREAYNRQAICHAQHPGRLLDGNRAHALHGFGGFLHRPITVRYCGNSPRKVTKTTKP